MLILVITLWEIVGKLKKLSAKSHLLRNFLAIRLPDCRTFSIYAHRQLPYGAICVNISKVRDKKVYWAIGQLLYIEKRERFCLFYQRNH